MARFGLLFALVAALAAPAFAQAPTGAISGTIVDQLGAVLPNIEVTVTNRDTGLTRVVTSGADGSFTVPLLPAGSYEVKVSAGGFQPILRPAEVVTGSATNVRLSLEV